MSAKFTTETFFRPDVIERTSLNIPAQLFNRCRLMLNRCSTEHLFVPIRAMQFLAVVDDEEIIFVDHYGGYAVRDGEGGKIIKLSWTLDIDAERDSLVAPIPIELVSYVPESRDLHTRLMYELPRALDRLEEKVRESGCEPKVKKVLPFRQE